MLKDTGMERICPECSNNKVWSLKGGRFRYTHCREKFSDPRQKIEFQRPNKAPLRLTRPISVASGKTNGFLFNIICPKQNAIEARKNRLFWHLLS